MVSGTASIEVMKGVKSIKDIDLNGKRVLIRVDYNVPLDDDLNITDDTRMRESLPTINYCIDHGAKSIVLVSHLGRPKGERNDKYSLRHIQKRVERLLQRDVVFFSDIDDAKNGLSKLEGSQVALLENIRFYDGETKNDEELSKKLGELCEVYVNDAFGTSHRKHASTYGVAMHAEERVAGLLIKKEIDSFAKALTHPQKPVTLVVGGAKVSGKLTLLKNIMHFVDKIVIGGAMSFTFLKALGYNMQKSLVEDELLQEATQVMEIAKDKGVKIYLPVDVVCTDDIKDPKVVKITTAQDIPLDFIGADIGPATNRYFQEVIKDSQTIIWNGPMGVFEKDKFSRGTFYLAHAIAEAYAYTVVGGGDTADAVDRAGEKDNMSFISTGGGASLELLEGKVLPAFEALDRK
ncbi:MAG: phosphoglycerate kinase [Campylobacterales bacterium]